MTTIKQIKAMSPEELRAASKKLAKVLVTRIAVGVAVSVAVTVISTLIVAKLDLDNEN